MMWAGKEENHEFEVDLVSLHVHERIDPLTIVNGMTKIDKYKQEEVDTFFNSESNNLPLRDAVDFYKHDQGWSNRLIAGDSLLVMNSLLKKEGMHNSIQMIYIDPPYGIKYYSNFQPFVNSTMVSENDSSISREPETIKAFRDTWELNIHSYLTYLRSRLLLSKKLLSETGSIFVQISTENMHHVREIMDEIFGPENFVSNITFRKKGMPLKVKYLESATDYILWYARNKPEMKYHKLFEEKKTEGDSHWNMAELPSGERIKLTRAQIDNHSLLPEGCDLIQLNGMYPAGVNQSGLFKFKFKGKTYRPPPGHSWKTNSVGMERLASANRLEPYADGSTIRYVLKLSDHPVTPLVNIWSNTPPANDKIYAVQTSNKVIQRCILMTTDPGDLVFDPTCGSGTVAYVAEQWGRRWITCDTSRVAITLAQKRLTTSTYRYYKLADLNKGVSGGFLYKKFKHLTLGSIANNETPLVEILYDDPHIDRDITRISGPFTVEAVPSPTVKSLNTLHKKSKMLTFDELEVANRQDAWRSELLKSGIRGQKNQRITFIRIDPYPSTRWIHADGETTQNQRVFISFGPEHAPLEKQQVEQAINEAVKQVPRPSMLIFVAMQFDPEASKDIDETNWSDVNILKVEVNKDLLTRDLRKKGVADELFWLMGQPDIGLSRSDGQYVVEVCGFDYFNTKTDEVESGGPDKIAMWMLDTDYDGRSIYPSQVFFPFDKKHAWKKLKASLKSDLDTTLVDKYSGTTSLPFLAGKNKTIAVKIIDDRGVGSLKVMELK